MKTRFFHPFLMLFIWAFWMVVPPLHSQEKNTPDWSDFMESLTEMMSETGDAETLDEELVEDLYELHCNPLNLNDLDKEKLIDGDSFTRLLDASPPTTLLLCG